MLDTEIDIIIYSFATLYHHNLVNSFNYVEVIDVFSKVSRFYLSEIQKVLNNESQEVDRRILNLETIHKLNKYFVETGYQILLLGSKVAIVCVIFKNFHNLV